MILGIDTSNYTTSVALLNASGELVDERRSVLEVQCGERGLRQSEALFQHLKNLPRLISEIGDSFEGDLTKVVVTSSPRSKAGSYMPVFLVGLGQAQSLTSMMNIPLKKVSHQEGHLMAGLWSAEKRLNKFLAVHLSGGTSDILKVKFVAKDKSFEVDELGESNDLHAGQFVDRVGVKMGLPFPAGPHLEELAKEGNLDTLSIPSSVKGYNMSFSGPTSAAMRAIEEGKSKKDIALALQRSIANSLEKVLKKGIEEEGIKDILIVGGVAANEYIRDRLRTRLEHKAVGAKLYFADPKYSTDNAVGVAVLGLE
ncbi:O-sialoglycoprotein endopeptidase [Halonatronum saccharophilum]|uniref:Kae1-like domain-containing protein n=1 Tax=Halonatronum saccharophilum TaxID=150060 RepID=UPI0004824FF6|nr:O-sialoglycoprotein endopeptidase [Halonatronum saccharophilum]